MRPPQTRLRLARLAAGFSLAQVAAAVGKSQMWVSLLERRRPGARVTLSIARKIAAFVGADVEDLFTRVQEGGSRRRRKKKKLEVR